MNKVTKIIVGVIILVIIAYGFHKVMKHQANMQSQTVTTTVSKPKVVPVVTENTVYKMMSNAKLSNFLTDEKGMTLYTFAHDTQGVSNCSGQCLVIWPAYVASSQNTKLPTDVTILTRSDGTLQYAYKGMPLYYYNKDKKPGDTNGNGIGGVWSVAK